MTDPRTLEMFFGPVDLSTGPFAVLGLSAIPTPRADIETARDERLLLIEDHPQYASFEADEARAAVQVAAAQLLDADVQQAVLNTIAGEPAPIPKQADPEEPRADEPTKVAARAVPQGVTPTDTGEQQFIGRGVPLDEFRDATRHALARAGGWNADGKRRLAALAAGEGVDASALRRVLIDINKAEGAARSTSTTAPSNTPAHTGLRTPNDDTNHHGHHHAAQAMMRDAGYTPGRAVDAAPRSASIRLWMNAATAVLFTLSGILLSLTLLVIIDRRSTQGPSAPVTPESETVATTPDPAERERVTARDVAELPSAAPAEPLASADERTLFTALRSLSASAINADPDDTLDTFAAAVTQLATRWPERSPQAIAGVAVPIRDVLNAAEDTGRGAEFAVVIAELSNPFLDAQANTTRAGDTAWRRHLFARALSAVLRVGLDEQTLAALADPAPPFTTASTATSIPSDDLWPRLAGALDDHASTMIARNRNAQRTTVSWDQWANTAVAVQTADPLLGIELLMTVAGDLLRSGIDPRDDETTANAVTALLAAARFSGPAATVARERLVEWFADDTIPTASLAFAMGRLFEAGTLDDPPSFWAISAEATPSERQAVLDDMADAFGIADAGARDRFARSWAFEHAELLRAVDSSTARTAIEDARATAALATLNQAAAHWWSGDLEAATEALDAAAARRAELDVDPAASVSGGPDDPMLEGRQLPGGITDGRWAEDFINARRNAEQRLVLLNTLSNRSSPLGRVDAAVLAETAAYSTPRSVRALAQRVAVAFADDPALVSGILEALPDAASTEGVLDTVRTIARDSSLDADDPAWKTSARRALVARLAELIGQLESRALIDASEHIATAYAARADTIAVRTTSDTDPDAWANDGLSPTDQAPAEAAAALFGAWRDRAARFAEPANAFASLPTIERRRTVRTQLASGAPQAFVAHQTSAAEVAAWLLSVQQPNEASTAADAIAAMTQRLRDADTVWQQMLAAERAAATLWSIRLDVHNLDPDDLPPPGTPSPDSAPAATPGMSS